MKKFSISTVFLTVFIDMLGVGIIIPVLAPLFYGQNSFLPVDMSTTVRGVLFGLLTATYPFAQFFGAPILGALADRKGRRPILLTSLAGTSIGYFLFGIGVIAHSLPLLYLSRLLDGFTGGNISVAMATIADITKPKDRAKSFGLIGMAFGLGFILGPYLGGKLADPHLVSWFTNATPFFFAALLALFNMALVILRLPETLKKKIHKPLSLLTGFQNFSKAFSLPQTRTLFLVVFFTALGFTFFGQFFQVYLVDHFHFTESRIGDVFGYIGLWIAFTQGFLTRVFNKYYRPAQIIRVALLGLAFVMPTLLVPQTAAWLFLVLPGVAIFNGLNNPNIMSLISASAGPESQGEILGIQQSVQAMGGIIPPVIAGLLATVDVRLPILMAGGLIFLGWLTFILFFKEKPSLFTKPETFHEV